MRILLIFKVSCLLAFQLLLIGCSQRELNDSERFDLYISTLRGDSTGYRIEYGIAERIDTLYGFYKLLPEYVNLGQQLQRYDSIALHYMARRDTVFNSRYIGSRDPKKSSYLNWNRYNDSMQLYLAKGASLRQYLDKQAIDYEKTVKGYLVSFSARLIGKDDTLQVHQFEIWLKHTAPVELLQKQVIDGSPKFY